MRHAAADAARRGAQRPHRLRAEPVGRAAAVPARRRSRAARAAPAAACPSMPRRSASAPGLAAIATATRTSRREVTRRACLLSRWVAADLYLQGDRGAARRAVARRRRRRSCRSGSATRASRTASCCASVRARLTATRDWIEASLRSEQDVTRRRGACIVEAGGACRRPAAVPSIARGHRACADRAGRLADLLRRVAAFGVTLARLDIRQDAARHTEALAAITSALGLGSYADWDEPARLEFLARELTSRRPLIPADLERHAGRARRARHVPHDRAHAGGLARRLRHHDDRAAPPTCWRWSCCRRRPASRRRCASCRSSRRRAICSTPAR